MAPTSEPALPTSPPDQTSFSATTSAKTPCPATCPLSQPQWTTLLLVADTLIPAPFSPAFHAYLNAVLLASPPLTAQLSRFLQRLTQRGVGSLLLTGGWSAFSELSRAERERVLGSWENGSVRMLRGVFGTLRWVVAACYLRVEAGVLRGIGYPAVEHGGGGGGMETVHRFRFKTGGVVEEADVVVVGSGAGGGVVAARLAESGLRVVVLERGEYVHPREFPLSEAAAGGRLYAGGGVLRSVDGNCVMLAGQTWGGGTVVNYSASLQLPAAVREEWAREYGLDFAKGRRFQECMDSVSNRMGVSIEHLTHNTPNSLLLEGARRLGMDAKTVPQNSGGHSHSCGNCCYGCHSNQKQSTTATYLVDACLAGAKCITSCKATQLLFSGTTITGITATLSSGQPIHIATPRVVLAAGSLQTPLLLSASGFQHPHLGKNLRIHPCTNIFIFFPAHAKTHPYRGPILSALLAETSNLDGAGYGSRGIVLPNHPGFAGAQLPWTDAATWQGRVDRYDQSILATSMVRDHDSSASVSADASGEPAVRFSFGAGDRRAGVEGLVALARCYVEMGAEEVVVDARGVGAWRRGDEFEDWVAELRRVGLQDRKASSAHQLGTARMAARREDGVCDPRGRVWRTEGLWVADGSLCPTATGVNPMVTIMGLAEYVADGVVEDFRKGGD